MLFTFGLVRGGAGPRHGAEALVGDGPAARFAQAVGARIQPGERVVDLFEKLEIVVGHGDPVVILDGRLGEVGRVGGLFLERGVAGLVLAVLVRTEDEQQVGPPRFERPAELLALPRRQRSVGFRLVFGVGFWLAFWLAFGLGLRLRFGIRGVMFGVHAVPGEQLGSQPVVASGPVRPFARGLAAGIACSLFVQAKVLSAQTAPAAEQPLTAALDLDPGATCLEQNRLEAEVQAWLGRDRLRSDIHVYIQGDEHDPRAVEFRIFREGNARERRFDGLPAGCEDATAVVGLAIALAIDANVMAAIVAPSAEASEPRGLFSAQVAGGFDVLPGVSLGATVGVEYRAVDWLSVRLDLLTQFSWGNVIDNASGEFDVGLGAASPQLCAGGLVAAGARFELCSGPAVGLLHAVGHGYTVSQSSTGPWVVATGGIRLRFVAGIAWAVDVDGVFPLHVPAFRAESAGGGPVYREPNPAGALLSIGPAFTF
jgi:hypothetical protein